MKKLIIFVLCIVIIMGIGIGVFLYFKKPKLAIEEILPQGPLVYVRFSDIEDQVEEINSSKLWQAIRELDYDLLMSKNALSQDQLAFIDLMKTQFSNPTTNFIFKKFFGQEVAVAIYPSSIDFSSLTDLTPESISRLMEDVFSNVFIITRIQPEAQFAEFISSAFEQNGADVSIETLDYKDPPIHIVTLEKINLKLAYVRYEDLIVIGMGEKAARLSSDVYNNDETALADDAQFQQMQKMSLDTASLIGYWNIEQFFTLLKQQMTMIAALTQQDSKEIQRQMDDFYKSVTGFKAIGLSAELGPISKMKMDMFFDKKEMNEDIAVSFSSCLSAQNKTIHFAPKDVLVYYWGSCFNLDQSWNQFKKEMVKAESEAGKPSAKDQLDNIEQVLGLSVEKDILPAFGDEFGGHLADIQLGGLFPIPKFLFFVKIENQKKAQNILARLTDQPIFVLQREEYSHIPLTYMASPLGNAVQPSYCFLEDYLLIAVNRQLLKDSIDAFNDDSLSLLASKDFQEVDFGLTDKNTAVQFIRTGEIIRKLRDIIEWSNQWVASKDEKRLAFKAGSERRLADIRENIQALEEELKNMQGDIVIIEDEIWNLDSQGLEISEKQTELNNLNNAISLKQKEVEAIHEQEDELVKIIEGYEDQGLNPETRRLYLDQLVYPLLKGFESIKVFGSRTTLDEGIIESSMYLKMEN